MAENVIFKSVWNNLFSLLKLLYTLYKDIFLEVWSILFFVSHLLSGLFSL